MATTYKVEITFKSFEGRNNLITGNTIGTDSLNFFASLKGTVDTDLLEEGTGYTVLAITLDDQSEPIPKYKLTEYGIEDYKFI